MNATGGRAERTGLARLLQPHSIAVIGGRYAEAVVEQCRGMAFAGEIWPIHPTRSAIGGYPCHRSVSDLPSAPDAAYVAVNRHQTVDVVAALAERGAGGAVVFAAGFGESDDDGGRLQRSLVDAAGRMRLIGPNCYGFINYLDGVPLWPDSHGGQRVERGVAILTQSSNIALNLTMNRRGLPLAYLCTLGNQAATGLSALAESILDDDRVTALGLHIEGIDDPAAFAAMTEKARDRGIPIVALKTGRSEHGARLTLGHTASIAGGDAVASALFRRLGIARLESVTALLECLKLLHAGGPLTGSRLVSLSCSGGEAALISDAASARAVTFPAFSEADRARIGKTVSPLVRVDNPFDYHTFDWEDGERLKRTFFAALSADIDIAALVLDLPRADRCNGASWRITLDAYRHAATRTGRRAAIIASLPECMPEDTARQLLDNGIAPLTGIDDALSAIEAAAFIGQCERRPKPWPRQDVPADPAVRSLDEWTTKTKLAQYGLCVPKGSLCDDADSAVAAAGEIGDPVVLKAVANGLHHKTELDAVRLGLKDPTAVDQAARALLDIGDRVLVETQITDGVAELILGVGRDPAVGPYLLIGIGGTLAELYADSAIVLLPVDADDIMAALRSLKAAPVLFGHRARPAGDIAAVTEAVLALQRFADDHRDRLLELEVNPLIVRPVGQGAVAVDGLLRFYEGKPDE